jgi:outer membrane protein insertion porin family/translocation and assembly module TamA
VPFGVGDEVAGVFLDPSWQVGADLREPFFLKGRASAGVGVSSHRRTIPGIVIDKGTSANASFTWRLADRVPGSITYRYEHTRVEAGDLYFCINFGVCALPVISALRGSHALSPLALTAHAERADDPLAPRRGYSARLDIEHASAFTVSDYRYNRVAAEFNRYFPRGRGVLAAHVRVGRVWASGTTSEALGIDLGGLGLLHPRKRFYAGGSRSVRGFAENQLGPRVLTIAPERLLTPQDNGDVAPCTVASIEDGTCDPNVAPANRFVPRPLGGNRLIEASLEYRFPLSRNLTAAVFVDGGSVYGRRLNLPPGDRSAVTPGLGIRYGSPIGPVRIDLGVRPRLTEELPVVTQLPGEDGKPRLVQLDTPMRYDPAGSGGGGFLRQVTSRLQLHLAIGEAW